MLLISEFCLLRLKFFFKLIFSNCQTMTKFKALHGTYRFKMSKMTWSLLYYIDFSTYLMFPRTCNIRL